MKATLAVLLFSTSMLVAGPLDLDPPHYETLPAIAAADSAIFPGAGWFYLSAHGGNWRDAAGGATIIAGISAGIIMALEILHASSKSDAKYFAAAPIAGVVLLRFQDIHMVSQRAAQLESSKK